MNRTTATASTEEPPVSSHALRPTDVPDSITDMMALAQMLATADQFVPPAVMGNAGNALALMLRARALNVEMAIAWDELYLSGGDVGMSARLVRALARRAGHRFKYVEHTRHQAVLLFQVAGEKEPHEVIFTMQDAMNMGLTDPEFNKFAREWERQPENMLVARVTTRAVTRHAPEVALGLAGLLTGAADEGLEVDSDAVSALKEEHRAAVAKTLREAEDTEAVEDGEKRLAVLRDVFVTGREAGVLDFAADDTGEYTVRQVLTEKLVAADQLAKQQAAKQQAEAQAAATEATEEPQEETPKPARKRASAKPAKAPQQPQGDAADGTAPAPPAKAAPAKKAPAKKPATKKAPARPPARPVSAARESRKAPCGCDVDSILTSGIHADECKDRR